MGTVVSYFFEEKEQAGSGDCCVVDRQTYCRGVHATYRRQYRDGDARAVNAAVSKFRAGGRGASAGIDPKDGRLDATGFRLADYVDLRLRAFQNCASTVAMHLRHCHLAGWPEEDIKLTTPYEPLKEKEYERAKEATMVIVSRDRNRKHKQGKLWRHIVKTHTSLPDILRHHASG
jgi:hypothetical protein